MSRQKECLKGGRDAHRSKLLVEQAKTLPLPFLAKEGKTTSVAIFCALVSVPPVQLTRVGCTTGYN